MNQNLFDTPDHESFDLRDEPLEDTGFGEAYAALEAELTEAYEELDALRDLLLECQAPLAAHALIAETPAVSGKVLALVRRIEVKAKPTAEETRKRNERKGRRS